MIQSASDIELPMAPEDMSMRVLLGEEQSVYSLIFQALMDSCTDRLDLKNVNRVADRFFVHWLNANPWCILQIVIPPQWCISKIEIPPHNFYHHNIIVNQSYKKITTRDQPFKVPRDYALERIIKDLKKRENL